jgi:hypothetical protein
MNCSWYVWDGWHAPHSITKMIDDPTDAQGELFA